MSLLDESRWKKHGERYATVITDDRGNASHLRLSMRDREQLLFAARVDIDVYDASGNVLHIAVRPSPRVRSCTENHEPAQDFQRGSSSPAPYMRADGLE
ncbi:hypothetical protein AVEN_175374-1 [Araneus ventricosus]|uniref:Uncharacterized protein n=1 Tax=Araneus ventricosus TaxID=182803 RepID=A0A4Y2JIN3_ARAVE|nr:hypothetical protein AVEN_175374-1 [Araneus ventricosus]